MGNPFYRPNIAKENYFFVRKNYEKQVLKLYEEIDKLKANKESTVVDDLILKYEKIFEYDNTNEKYYLEYLLLFLEKLKEGKIDKEIMKEKLGIFNIFISDNNYIKHFPDFKRTNSITKINNLIEFLKSDLNNDKTYIKRKTFINKIYELQNKNNIFYSSNIKFKQPVTWKNKELYLFNIYMNFLESLINKIEFYKNSFSSLALESEAFIEKQKAYYISKNEKIFKELQLLKIYEGEFMKIYMESLQTFLTDIDKNYQKRFFKDEDYLDEEKDRNLFEDYLQFLISYNFNGNDIQTIINFWKETFLLISNEEMLRIIGIYNKLGKLNFELKENTLIIKKNGNEIKTINDIAHYVFENLVDDIKINYKSIDLDYYLYKNLKPNYYNNKLFIMKNKNSWKKYQLIS